MKKFLSIVTIVLLFNNIVYSVVLFDSTSIVDEIWHGLGSYKFNFKFKNIGKNSIRIVSVTTSCACTVARLKKDKYGPEESGEINGTFNILGRRGFQEQEITADTESDNQTRSDAPGDSISVLFLCRMSRNLHPQFLDPLFVISLHLVVSIHSIGQERVLHRLFFQPVCLFSFAESSYVV